MGTVSEIYKVIESQDFAGLLKHRSECVWIPYEEAEILARPSHDQPATYNIAFFEVAGTILSREFHMSPHGDWDASDGCEFKDHFGSFLLSALGSNAITLTWESVLRNLVNFQTTPTSATLVTANAEIRFHHKLFKMTGTSAPRRQDPFAIVNLPTKNDTQRLMLSTLQTQGQTFRPLPAKDTSGRLILPKLYESLLPQALVAIKFQIKRQFVETSKCYDYSSEVIELNILSHTNVVKEVKTNDRDVPKRRKQNN